MEHNKGPQNVTRMDGKETIGFKNRVKNNLEHLFSQSKKFVPYIFTDTHSLSTLYQAHLRDKPIDIPTVKLTHNGE